MSSVRSEFFGELSWPGVVVETLRLWPGGPGFEPASLQNFKGILQGGWVARKPPGFAFIDFDDKRDAQDAIRDLDGKNGWRVELSRNTSSGRGGRDRYGGSESKCYECGETGHFARECRLRIGSGGLGSGRRRSRSRSRSRSPRYCRSPSYGRRSYSPAVCSPRRHSVSPARGRSYSRSPQYNRDRDESPYDNGYRRSRS